MASLGEIGEGLNRVLDKAAEVGAALRDQEFPASAQCPADVVLRACVEFMETGGALPSQVEWQPWPSKNTDEIGHLS